MASIRATIIRVSLKLPPVSSAASQSLMARSSFKTNKAPPTSTPSCRAIRWHPHRLIFYAFDLIHLDGKDLRERPLIERRAALKDLLRRSESPLQFSEEFTGDPAAFFQACAEHRLEGMISKLATSRYRSGRSKTWLKTKCFTESSLIIIGTDRDRKTGATRALLARADKGELAYAGAAFIPLNSEQREELQIHLERIKAKHCAIPKLRLTDASWVKPQLVARVRSLAGATHLRHATVRGFR